MPRPPTGRTAGDMIRVSRATKERLAAIKAKVILAVELCYIDAWWSGNELTFDALINELCRRWEKQKSRRRKAAANRSGKRPNGRAGK